MKEDSKNEKKQSSIPIVDSIVSFYCGKYFSNGSCKEQCVGCAEAEHNFNPVTRICTKCNQHIYDALEDYDDSEDDFECCGECDLPDACNDFGCAIKQGLKEPMHW